MSPSSVIGEYFSHLIDNDPSFMPLQKNGVALKNGAFFDVVSTDTRVEGVHFPIGLSPGDIASNVIRHALSVFSATGCSLPVMVLSVGFPESQSNEWLTSFAVKLAEEKKLFGFRLWAVNPYPVHGPCILTTTFFGSTLDGMHLCPSGGMEGDRLYVTGTIGDSALGKKVLEEKEIKCLEKAAGNLLVESWIKPTPYIRLGKMLAGHAHSCVLLCDGLAQGATCLAQMSGFHALIRKDWIPLSDATKKCLEDTDPIHREKILKSILYGPSDGQLLFSISLEHVSWLEKQALSLDLQLTHIGHLTALKPSNPDETFHDKQDIKYFSFIKTEKTIQDCETKAYANPPKKRTRG